MIKRIKGVTAHAVLDGCAVDVVFRSPYRWRIYEGSQEVTREFGFNGRRVDDADPRWSAFHDAVRAGTVRQTLQIAR